MSSEHLPHDPAYKQFFSDPIMVESLLRDFVSEDFINDLDFSTLEHCAGSYVTDDLRERHDDVIWRVRWKGSWMYLYLLLEFQSSPDPWMAVRILAYTAMLWQDLIRSGVVRKKDPLPPVFPLVIYNGSGTWNAARDVGELLSPMPERLAVYQPRQRYWLLEENRVPDDALRRSDGVAAQLLRLERARSLEEVRSAVRELMERLRAPEYLRLRRAFSVWLGRVVFKRSGITRDVPEFQDLQEVNAMLEERAAQWGEEYRRQGLLAGLEEGRKRGWMEGQRMGLLQGREEGRVKGREEGRAEGQVMGREEGRVEGRAEGRVEGRAEGRAEGIGLTLSGLLEDRFGSLPLSVTEAIAAAKDTEALLRLTRSVYKVASLQAFVALLQEVNEEHKG